MSNLFDNIRKRQKSGKPARKVGSKGAPTAKAWNTAAKAAKANAAKKKKK